MMARLPDGDPAPRDGALPASALATLRERALGVYVHVPFCTERCGYCDFNVYIGGALRDGFVDGVRAELALAARVFGDDARPATTVFLGGGTPTVLGTDEIAAMLGAVAEHVGIEDGAEITIEANPEDLDGPYLRRLRDAGVTSISLGMQSAQPRVLAALDRLHTPGRAHDAAVEARAAGFDVIGLDLIFGCHAESDDDWARTLAEAVALRPDRVSAYELTIEPGTRLHAAVRTGALPAPDEDARARRYVAAEQALGAAGLEWYEISSWARDERSRSRHNIGYWTSANWWGVGPGAHSHVGGVRWWNVLHPRRWRERLAAGLSPAAAREHTDATARRLERVMLELRLADGAPVELADAAALRRARDDELLTIADGRAVLTLRGRLIADTVVRALAT